MFWKILSSFGASTLILGGVDVLQDRNCEFVDFGGTARHIAYSCVRFESQSDFSKQEAGLLMLCGGLAILALLWWRQIALVFRNFENRNSMSTSSEYLPSGYALISGVEPSISEKSRPIPPSRRDFDFQNGKSENQRDDGNDLSTQDVKVPNPMRLSAAGALAVLSSRIRFQELADLLEEDSSTPSSTQAGQTCEMLISRLKLEHPERVAVFDSLKSLFELGLLAGERALHVIRSTGEDLTLLSSGEREAAIVGAREDCDFMMTFEDDQVEDAISTFPEGVSDLLEKKIALLKQDGVIEEINHVKFLFVSGFCLVACEI